MHPKTKKQIEKRLVLRALKFHVKETYNPIWANSSFL